MPTDSSGNYSLPASYFVETGDDVLPEQHNPPFEDVASGLTARIHKDGRTVWTGDQQAGGFKVTGLANGVADADAATVGQMNDAIGYFQHLPEVIKTDDYTVLTSDVGKALIANKATAITFTLPSVAGAGDGPYLFRNIGAGNLTLDGNSAETIEGATTLVLKQGDMVLLYPNGTTWRAYKFARRQTTTDNTLARFDGTAGDIQPSSVVIDDNDNIVQSGTGANSIPTGTTAQRPTASQGMLRENTTLDVLEHYNGTAWRILDRPLLHLRDIKSNGTNGGTFSAGDWRTRTVNTEVTDEIGSTLSSNQFSLPAGTYEVDIRVPAYNVASHQARLQNITDSSVALGGTSEYSAGASAQSISVIRGRFTIAAQKTFEVQHQSQSSQATNGLGVPANIGTSEIYTDVMIWRIA